MNAISTYSEDQAEYRLEHPGKTIDKSRLTLPGPDYLDNVFINSIRNAYHPCNIPGVVITRINEF